MDTPDARARVSRLQVGTPFQLTFRHDSGTARYFVRLIGYLPGHSLIVTTPVVDGKTALVKEGSRLVVRALTGNDVIGFESEVLRSQLRPYPYLHLAFPQAIEELTVRKAQRVGVRLIASVLNETDGARGAPQAAEIADLSTAGAMVLADQPLGAVGDVVSVSVRLAVGGAEEYLSLSAVIRNVKPDPGGGSATPRLRHGLEFQLLEQDETMALHRFVYEQLLQNVIG